MPGLLDTMAFLAALIAAAGIVQCVLGFAASVRFRRRLSELWPAVATAEPITILKPLCGDEPLLEEALATVCAVDYPAFQVVFGVQDPADPAIAIVERLHSRFPAVDMKLVIDATPHGVNRKIANLINMFPAARHDLLVIGDSDVHVGPDYLHRISQEFGGTRTGVVTTLYAGLPASRSFAAQLGATGLSHGFLPGALLARGLGRQDTLGATMAIRRGTLISVGGLAALAPYLADDHRLGELVKARGLDVRLAATLTSTTVPEVGFGALFRHELRWARTILSLVPVGFALSSIQFPLFWAGLAWALSGGASWALAVFAASWGARAACAFGIDRALQLSKSQLAGAPPLLLLPLRDFFSIAVMLASTMGDQVEWRGRVLRAQRGDAPAEMRYPTVTPARAASAG